MRLFLVSLHFCIIWALAAYEDDYVSNIPGYTGKDVNFDTYSGYLDALSGRLFYFFTQSSDDPDNNPLILWLNGGPGCSSLIGQFIEIGAFHPYNYGENIEYNPYSWNNFASILYIESPPCVGYSFPYSLNCHTYTTNDNQTKWDNYIALQSFFIKFPEFKNHKFMIMGESYAGHYIPQLAQLIDEQNKKSSSYIHIKLESVGIGNPYINRDTNWFQGWIPTMYSFGILNEEQLNYLNSKHCINQTFTQNCSVQSWNFVDKYLYDINVYDVNVLANCSRRSRQETELLRYIYKSPYFVDNLHDANTWSYPYTPCNEYDLVWYLNGYKVWDAFHVNKSWMNSIGNINNNSWQVCSWYYNGYDVNMTDNNVDQVQYIKYLLQNHISVLIYSGNNDLVCAYSGTRYWIYNRLNESDKGSLETNWTSWHVNGEVGGWYQSWNKFTFVVVRDAGHEVPEYQPIRAYSLFQRFLLNDYSDKGVVVYHTDWMDYSSLIDDGNDSKNNANNNMGIGIVIGILIGIGFVLIVIAILWLKNNYLNKRIQSNNNSIARVILEESDQQQPSIQTTTTANSEQ